MIPSVELDVERSWRSIVSDRALLLVQVQVSVGWGKVVEKGRVLG